MFLVLPNATGSCGGAMIPQWARTWGSMIWLPESHNKKFDHVKATRKDSKMWNEQHVHNKTKENNTDSI